jgi:multiple sugar transport system ATP-binding protein
MEAIALSDQMAVMREGRVEQVGAYQELRQSPINAFVAGFLGSPPMNLLTGGTVADGMLYLGEIAVPLPDAVKSQVRSGQEVILGVRSEAAYLICGDQPLPDGVRLRGTVEVVEPDFPHRTQLVYVRTGAFSYAATGDLDTSLNVGDEVEVVFSADHLHFFDGESEQRIG